MSRPSTHIAALTRRDRTRYHQVHPVKLAVDWGSAVIAGALLWRRDWVAAVAMGFGPSIVTTTVFLSGRFDDALGRIRSRRRPRSIVQRLSPAVDAMRLGGLAVAWMGCWLHRPWWILAGALVIVFGWWLAWRGPTLED
jgi:hypothetical protein